MRKVETVKPSGVALEHRRPLVSVVVIFFNQEQFLPAAVDSILAQSFSDWELLLVDDGSTDDSTAFGKQSAGRFPQKIRYLEHGGHANRGMSASRNAGLAQAQGDYVLFLDSDDVLVPQALSEMLLLMKSHPEVVSVHGPMQLWYSWTGKPEDRNLDELQALHMPLNRVVDPPEATWVFLARESAIPSGNLFRSDVLRQVGGFEDAFTGMYEDQVLRVKICTQYPIYASTRSWYKYRRHAESFCSMMIQTGRVDEARARFLEWAEGYCRTQGLRDYRVRKAIRQALLPYRYPRLTQYQETVVLYSRSVKWQIKEGSKSVMREVLPDSVVQWLKHRLGNRSPEAQPPSSDVHRMKSKSGTT